MSFRTKLLIALGAMSIAGAAAVGVAQAPIPGPPAPGTPTVISGMDVGFQVDRWVGNVPEGRWVVRHPLTGGRWVEPRPSNRIRPAESR